MISKLSNKEIEKLVDYLINKTILWDEVQIILNKIYLDFDQEDNQEIKINKYLRLSNLEKLLTNLIPIEIKKNYLSKNY